MKIKTIDINALEWFDKVNGNSYFAGTITVNYGLPTEKTYKMPFQYGYGDHYKDMAFQKLEQAKVLRGVIHHENGSNEGLWQYAQRHKIIVRASKQTGCKQRELKAIIED